MNNALRPEIYVLLQCARLRFDSESGRQVKTLIRKDVDWPSLLQLAHDHRVIPIVYSALNSTCPDAVPAPVLERLRDYFYANAGRNLFLTRKLVELLQAFDSHGIPAIPYKGATLAALIYGDLGLRQVGDLDILVRERDYGEAQGLLIERHFRQTIEHEWESEFTDESGTVAVDLHKRITNPEFSCPLSFNYLLGRLQPITLGATVVPGLCPEDTLLMLCIQVTKDRCPQLVKFCDIAELIRRHERLNWEAAVKQAKSVGGRRIMLFGLSLTANLLGAALPHELMRDLQINSRVKDLVECASEKIFRVSHTTACEGLETQQFRWLLRERLRDKLYPYYYRYVRGIIVPCELDRRLLRLPERLSFLYWFFRPIRLIAKYGVALPRRMWVSLLPMSPERAKTGARHH